MCAMPTASVTAPPVRPRSDSCVSDFVLPDVLDAIRRRRPARILFVILSALAARSVFIA